MEGPRLCTILGTSCRVLNTLSSFIAPLFMSATAFGRKMVLGQRLLLTATKTISSSTMVQTLVSARKTDPDGWCLGRLVAGLSMTYLVLSGRAAVLRSLSRLRTRLYSLSMTASMRLPSFNREKRCRRFFGEFASVQHERRCLFVI